MGFGQIVLLFLVLLPLLSAFKPFVGARIKDGEEPLIALWWKWVKGFSRHSSGSSRGMAALLLTTTADSTATQQQRLGDPRNNPMGHNTADVPPGQRSATPQNVFPIKMQTKITEL